jgi:O-antigen/teichoic acid export membrane protein
LLNVAYGLADQGLAVSGGFLVNVALARAQSKEDYGLFALSYSVFAFLLGLYYAAILEPYTVYASGRYRERYSAYLRLMVRINAVLCVSLTALFLLSCLLLHWVAPQFLSRALLGLALTAGILLSGYFLRRIFYVQRQPSLAAKSSLAFFIGVAGGLFLLGKWHRLDSFTVFLVLAFGWIIAGIVFRHWLEIGQVAESFLASEPEYWRTHWKYAKWVLATAFVFQFTHQGYYWLVGGFLSAAEVANLRAMYLLIAPIEQVFIAFSYLIVPALSARFATRNMGDFFALWRKYSLATVGLSAVYAFLVRLFGAPLVHMIYAGKYDGLSPYLFALALVPLVMWVGSAMGHALSSVEKPHFVFWAYVSSGIATFAIGIPLVIHFGLWGAVYGMLLSGATYSIALAISFVIRFRGDWRQAALAKS